MLKVKTFQESFSAPYDAASVSEFLTKLGSPCTEIRIFPHQRQLIIDKQRINAGKCINGYYTDYDKAAEDILELDGKGEIYATLQPCDPKLLRRGENKLNYNAHQTVSDSDILSYEWILIDIDPDRPANTSSSDLELQASIDTLNKMISKTFDPLGIEVLRGLSGNGCHGLIKISSQRPDKPCSDKIKQILGYLANRYDTDLCKVDQTVYNPSRIIKLYGTLACKGENKAEAPHRRSKFTDKKTVEVDINLIYNTLIKEKPPKPAERGIILPAVNIGSDLDLDIEAYLTHHSVSFSKSGDTNGEKYKLQTCPFDEAHGQDAAVFKSHNGILGFKCFHNGCADNDWKSFRAKVGQDLKPFLIGLEQHVAPQVAPLQKEGSSEEDHRKTIIVNGRQLIEVLADINEAVTDFNDPATLFARGGHPTWIRRDENGYFYSEILNTSDAKIYLSQAAKFCRKTVRAEGLEIITSVFPSLEICQAFLAQKQNLPALKSIISFPAFKKDSDLLKGQLQQVGYDEGTKYFCASSQKPNLDMPVTEAKRFIFDELLVDFPFTESGSRANSLALMLTPLIIPLLPDGSTTPLFGIDSSSPGTGKGLLTHVCTSAIVSEIAMQVLPTREEELKKNISSLLMSSPTFVVYDNVSQPIRSQSLASVLTSSTWSDRLLGGNKMLRIPNVSTWIATGNNLGLSNEIARRTIWIRLDSDVERPWKRTGFKHHNLRKFLADNQLRILSSLLSIIKLWIDAGRPKGKLSIGSFEAWAETVSGILEVCQVGSFMANQDALYDKLDYERQAWSAFIDQWFAQYETRDVNVSTLYKLAATNDEGEGEGLLAEQLVKFRTDHSRKIGLGQLLREKEGRIFNSLRITSPGQRSRAKIYALIPIRHHHAEDGPAPRQQVKLDDLLVDETADWLEEIDTALEKGVPEQDLVSVCQIRQSDIGDRYYQATEKLDQLLASLDS